jgi:hypothetical protein
VAVFFLSFYWLGIKKSLIKAAQPRGNPHSPSV